MVTFHMLALQSHVFIGCSRKRLNRLFAEDQKLGYRIPEILQECSGDGSGAFPPFGSNIDFWVEAQ